MSIIETSFLFYGQETLYHILTLQHKLHSVHTEERKGGREEKEEGEEGEGRDREIDR